MNARRLLWLGTILLAACTTAVPTTVPTAVSSEETESETPFAEIDSLAVPTAVLPAAAPIDIPDHPALNRRVVTDEEYRFPSLIPYDGIPPIYEPVFVSAKDAPYEDDELVMGIAWGGEAKAYPVTVLRFREIVNDELDGIPTLVTW